MSGVLDLLGSHRGARSAAAWLLAGLMGASPAVAAEGGSAEERPDPARPVCLTEEDRERALLDDGRRAFQATSIPLGPLFWATADRQLVQAMLVYWRVLDVEEDTRLTLFLPWLVEHCRPGARSWLGPFALWGGQRDADGTAGWWGPYFYRRDEQAESDVLFPIAWSLREPDRETTVFGPWFRLRRPGSDTFGLAPLYLGHRAGEAYLDAGPGFARWGRPGDRRWAVAQTYVRETSSSTTVASAPFWLSHHDWRAGSFFQLVPGFARWGDVHARSLLAGPLFHREEADGGYVTALGPAWRSGEPSEGSATAALAPLFFHRTTREGHLTLIPPLAYLSSADEEGVATVFGPAYDRRGIGGEERGVFGLYHSATITDPERFESVLPLDELSPLPKRFWAAPPLLSFGYTDPAHRLSFFAGAYSLRTKGSLHRGVLPLYAQGRYADGGYYDVAPLALTALWGDEHERAGVIAQTWFRLTDDEDDWELASAPFYFGGRRGEGAHWNVIPPALYGRWGDTADEERVIAGPWLSHARGDRNTWALLPILVGGSSRERSWLLGPGFARWTEGERRDLLVAQTWLRRQRAGWTLASAPFYFGRVDDEAERYLHVVPPLGAAWWGQGEDERYLLAAGWVDLEDDDGRDAGLLPFYLSGASRPGRTTTPLVRTLRGWLPALPGLPGGEGALRYALAPGYLHLEEGERTTTVVGQTFTSRDEHGAVFGSLPFYFGQRWGRGEEQGYLDVAPPLLFARWGQGAAGGAWAGPWFTFGDDDERATGLLPVFLGRRGPEGSWWASPVAASWHDDDTQHLWAGQTWASWDDEGWLALSAPFYFGGRHRAEEQGGAAFDVVPPLLYARWREGAKRVAVTGTHVDVHLENGARYTALAPLYLTADADEGGFAVGPGYWRRWSPGSTTTWLAQTRWRTEGDAWSLASHPLYYGGVDEDGAYHHSVPLALTFLWGAEAPGVERHSRVVGPLFHLEGERGADAGLAPLYAAGEGVRTPLGPTLDRMTTSFFGDRAGRPFSAPSGYRYRAAPGYFVVEDRAGRERSALYGQTFLHTEAGPDGKAGAWQVWSAPFYFGADDGQDRYHVAPLLLSGHWASEREQTDVTVIAPLAYAAWSREGRRTKLIGPWLEHDEGEDRYRGLLPLWLDAQRGAAYLQMMSPAVWRWGERGHDGEAGSERTLAPLYWHRKDGRAEDRIVFPLWWDVSRPDYDVTVAGGAVWRVAWNKESAPRSLLVAPGYARYEDDDEQIQVAGPVAWSRGKADQAQAWSLHLGPALSVWSHHSDHFRWQALLGVLGYEREGDREQLTVLFVKTPPREVPEA